MVASRGQNWSVDLIIGVLVFLIGIGVIVSLLGQKQQDDPTPLRIESEIVAVKLTQDENLQVAPGNQLDERALFNLAKQLSDNPARYEGLKEQFGIQNEYCIYLRDENGNLVFIQDPDALPGNPITSYAGIGSGSNTLNLTNQSIPCGKQCAIQANGQCT